MIKKCFGFTLIEIIIATSLFAILIFSTTSLFFRYQKLKTRITDIRPYVLERAFFFDKMTDMTLSLDSTSIKDQSLDYNEFLSFTFDNGFKDSPFFSGKCSCELFRTHENELIYKIISSKKELSRIFLSHISSFRYEVKNDHLHIYLIDTDERHFNYAFSIKPSQEVKK
ncbi:MAG: hypothetical protein S4CHLAM20_12690 [Chlamydiia bacterium]|nr:hypothetical protein [Chlamydiia bacterium]